MKKTVYKTIFMGITILANTALQACTINLFNNTTQPIMIKQRTQKKSQKSGPEIIINSGQTAAIGDNTQHACFDVHTLNQTKVYSPLCTVTQHACSMGKKIELKASDIPNNIDLTLFSVSPAPQ